MATKDYNENLRIVRSTTNNPEVVSYGVYHTRKTRHVNRSLSLTSGSHWRLRSIHRMINISAGLAFLHVLFITLLQVHFVLAGCRSEKRAECESICIPDGNQSWNCTVRAVIILPENTTYDVSLPKVSPVFALAEKKIQDLQLLPPHIKFEWIFYDDKCDASYATISAMDGYGKNCAHVLFGPSCEYAIASVSRITKYFRSEGTPLITAGGASYNFEDDKTSCLNEFYMLIRTGLISFKTIGKFLLAMMKKFHWNDAVFFYERDGQSRVAGLHTCHLMMNSVAHIFREANVTYSSYTTDAGTGNLTEDMKREIGINNASE